MTAVFKIRDSSITFSSKAKRSGPIVIIALPHIRPDSSDLPGGTRLPMQAAQQCAFFPLVALHTLQDIVEHLDGLDDVRSLIQHDAFRPLAHHRIANLGPARFAGL